MFDKYQQLLLRIANHPLGRAYLGLKDAPVVKITPNSAHYLAGFNKKLPLVTAHFYSSPRYAKKLQPVLAALLAYENYGNMLRHVDYLLPAIIEKAQLAGLMAGVTGSFYSDASPESVSVDGHCGIYYVTSTYSGWAAHRAAATGDDTSDTSGIIYMDLTDPNSTKFSIYRGFMLYDTSSLATALSVDSANWVFQYASVQSDTGWTIVDKLYLVSSNPASNTAVVNADFDAIGGTSFGVQTTVSAKSINTEYTIALNASGLANINTTGISKFGLRQGNDFENTDPNAGSGKSWRMQIYSADAAARDQYLSVTYTPAPIGGSPMLFGGGVTIG